MLCTDLNWKYLLLTAITIKINIDNFHSIHEYFVPNVKADAGANAGSTVNEESSDDEGVADDQQAKKKQKKEKIGFRDRKVMPNIDQSQQLSQSQFFLFNRLKSIIFSHK